MNQYNVISSVIGWNLIIGNTPDTQSAEDAQKAFDEEEEEWFEAVKVVNELDQVDALFDMLWTYIQLQHVKGTLLSDDLAAEFSDFANLVVELDYDPEKVWNIGAQSNWDKFFTNKAKAAETADFYYDKGINCEVYENDHFWYVKADNKDQVDADGKKYYPNKLLKPVTWEEPDWVQAKL